VDKGLKLRAINKITYRTYQFDFDNAFSYVEKRKNSAVYDCYLVETEELFPDGTVKPGGIKYFYCFDTEKTVKNVKTINCLTFDGFDKLFFIDEMGECKRNCLRQEGDVDLDEEEY